MTLQLFRIIMPLPSHFSALAKLSACMGLLCLFSNTVIAATDEKLQLVTTIKPLQLISQAIAGDKANISVLLPATQSPHHYSMSPSDRFSLNKADLFIWVGPPLEVFFIDTVAQLSQSVPVITAIELESLNTLPLIDSHVHENHAAAAIDPHIWLDPDNAVVIAQSIVTHLVTIDAKNADYYRLNFTRFEHSLQALKSEIQSQLEAIRDRPYIVYHNAYQYFERQFALQHSLALVTNPESQPSIRQILQTREQLKNIEPVCLLLEQDSPSATIKTFLGNAQLRQSTLDLLGGSIAVDEHAYENLLRKLSSQISNCLQD